MEETRNTDMCWTVPRLRLDGSVQLPVVGLGTGLNANRMEHSAVTSFVSAALDSGYRYLDCARAYQTEDAVGKAVRTKLDEGNLDREDLVILSKLFHSYHHPDDVPACLEKSMRDLGTDYLDVYLMHAPVAIRPERKRDKDGVFLPDIVDPLQTWEAMEKLYRKEIVRSIGVSNFNASQLQRLVDEADVKPVLNQIESHPYFPNEDLIRCCNDLGVHVTAYSPFASSSSSTSTTSSSLFDDPVVVAIAEKKNMTPGQVLLRFALDRGLTVVPRSTNPSRLQSNLHAANPSLDFRLTSDELSKLLSLERKNGRTNWLKEFRNCIEWPFKDNRDTIGNNNDTTMDNNTKNIGDDSGIIV